MYWKYKFKKGKAHSVSRLRDHPRRVAFNRSGTEEKGRGEGEGRQRREAWGRKKEKERGGK